MVEGWKNSKLGSLAYYINGHAFKPTDWKKFGLLIIRIEQLKDPKAKCDYYDKKLTEDYKIDNGDLIFSWSATLALKIWDRGEAWLNQHLFKVIPKEGTNKIFLKYLIEFNLDKLAGETHGSTMKHITRPHLLNFEVSIPKEEIEQSKIAEILTKIDEAINQTEKIIEKQERTKTGLMQDFFTKGIDENGKIRSEETHKFRDSPIGMIPEEWDVTSLSNVVEIKGRVGWRGYAVKDLRDFGPLTLGAGNISDKNKLNLTEKVHLSMEKYLESPEIMVKENDILIVQRGSIGKLAIIDCGIGEATINPSMILCKQKKMLNKFIYYFLCSFHGQKQINDSISQTGVPMISQSQCGAFIIPKPKRKSEQIEMVDMFFNLDLIIEQEKQKLTKLKHIKAGLMQDLLTGKVKVTHSLEQEAAV